MSKKHIAILLVSILLLSMCCTTALAAENGSLALSYDATQTTGTNRYIFWAQLESGLPEDLDVSITVYRISGSSRVRVGGASDSDTDVIRVLASTTITIIPGSTYLLDISGSGNTANVSHSEYFYF